MHRSSELSQVRRVIVHHFSTLKRLLRSVLIAFQLMIYIKLSKFQIMYFLSIRLIWRFHLSSSMWLISFYAVFFFYVLFSCFVNSSASSLILKSLSKSLKESINTHALLFNFAFNNISRNTFTRTLFAKVTFSECIRKVLTANRLCFAKISIVFNQIIQMQKCYD